MKKSNLFLAAIAFVAFLSVSCSGEGKKSENKAENKTDSTSCCAAETKADSTSCCAADSIVAEVVDSVVAE